MIGSWTPWDTLNAALTVQEAARREAVQNSYRQTIRETEQLDEGIAELRRELAELTAQVDARAAKPKRPAGRKRARK